MHEYLAAKNREKWRCQLVDRCLLGRRLLAQCHGETARCQALKTTIKWLVEVMKLSSSVAVLIHSHISGSCLHSFICRYFLFPLFVVINSGTVHHNYSRPLCPDYFCIPFYDDLLRTTCRLLNFISSLSIVLVNIYLCLYWNSERVCGYSSAWNVDVDAEVKTLVDRFRSGVAYGLLPFLKFSLTRSNSCRFAHPHYSRTLICAMYSKFQWKWTILLVFGTEFTTYFLISSHHAWTPASMHVMRKGALALPGKRKR